MQGLQHNLRSIGKLTAVTALAGTFAFGSFVAPAQSAGSSTGSYTNKYSGGGSSTGSYSGSVNSGTYNSGSYVTQDAGTYNGGTVQGNTGAYNGSTVQTYAPTVPSTGTAIIGGNAGDTGNYVNTGEYVFPAQ